MVTKLLDLIFFGRPMLVIPVWTVYLHYHAVNIQTATDSPFAFNLKGPGLESIISLIALTLIFKGVYVFNQIFDIESDRINDKLFFLPRGLISLRTAGIYYIILSIAGVVIAAWLSWTLFFPGLLIVGLGILYSIPGIKLKDRPLEGLLANSLAYGFLIPRMAMTGDITPDLMLATLPYFLAIASGYILTTIPDADGDAASGKRTVAVILGPKGALILALLTLLATASLSLGTENRELLIVAAVTAALVLILLGSFKFKLLMLACKLPILILTLLAGAHYPFYLVLLLLTIALTRIYYKWRFKIIYPKLG